MSSLPKHYRWFAVFLLLLTASCTEIPGAQPTPTHESTPTATSLPEPTLAATSKPSGPLTINLWLPPEFDPESGTPAGDILKARLKEFTDRRTNTRVLVRIKTPEGPGGMLDSLTTANAAAPLAIPDLVALPRPDLEVAALKGLLRPFDNLVETADDPDWFPFARQMARLQNSTYGIPFAGDAQMLVYDPVTIPAPPRTLSDTLNAPGPLAFAAADPQALFTLAQYQANGGAILDAQERPWLDIAPLTEVLTYYQSAAAADLIPVWVTQLENDDQVWEAFNDGNAEMIITWISNHLKEVQADSAAAPMPTTSGKPFSLATGWVWALASPEPEHQAISVELAQWLSGSDFLARWTAALGYLPPRPSALASWQMGPQRALAGEIAANAQLIPSSDVLNSLSPLLEKATLDILKRQTDAATAAQQAANSLTSP
jgi:ABC-type glycerol-3-phosphate transport system substrate-binding protein